MFQNMIYCIRENTDILILNVMIKNLYNLSKEKTHFFYP